tara:strand:- start:71 stop:304 length:234 start_codon:yes stop_codon:yes gene_type:complete
VVEGLILAAPQELVVQVAVVQGVIQTVVLVLLVLLTLVAVVAVVVNPTRQVVLAVVGLLLSVINFKTRRHIWHILHK